MRETRLPVTSDLNNVARIQGSPGRLIAITRKLNIAKLHIQLGVWKKPNTYTSRLAERVLVFGLLVAVTKKIFYYKFQDDAVVEEELQ